MEILKNLIESKKYDLQNDKKVILNYLEKIKLELEIMERGVNDNLYFISREFKSQLEYLTNQYYISKKLSDEIEMLEQLSKDLERESKAKLGE